MPSRESFISVYCRVASCATMWENFSPMPVIVSFIFFHKWTNFSEYQTKWIATTKWSNWMASRLPCFGSSVRLRILPAPWYYREYTVGLRLFWTLMLTDKCSLNSDGTLSRRITLRGAKNWRFTSRAGLGLISAQKISLQVLKGLRPCAAGKVLGNINSIKIC